MQSLLKSAVHWLRLQFDRGYLVRHCVDRAHMEVDQQLAEAIVDAFHSHPDFLTVAGHRSAVPSIAQRVVSQLVGYAKQAQGAVIGGDFADGFRSGTVRGGASEGMGRSLLPPPHTRLPALYSILCGGEQ